MNRQEWDSIKTGDIIYTVQGGNARLVISGAEYNKSRCIRLENGVVYASCDKLFFTFTPPVYPQIRRKIRKFIRSFRKYLI